MMGIKMRFREERIYCYHSK